jgi:hypothetical protein
MTYVTVIVSLALDRSNDARLEIAGQLAERFGAHVIGITAGEFSPPLYFTTRERAQKLLDEGQAAIRNRVAEAETQFRPAMQKGRDALSDPCMQANPGDLVMQMGRPLLVVPDTSSWLDLRSVLIAWKDTPEARRATTDALPILRKAKDVTVAEII